jgi:hypothetical protein
MREVQFLAKTCAGELFFSLTSMGKFWGQSVLVKWFFYLTFSDFQKLGIITFRKQSISKIEVIKKCQKQKYSHKLIFLNENKIAKIFTLKINFGSF